jgi:hypothetical protein
VTVQAVILVTENTMKKKQQKSKRKHTPEVSTYDPKIHVRTGSGYHMKKSAPKGDFSGAQLKDILDGKVRRD